MLSELKGRRGLRPWPSIAHHEPSILDGAEGAERLAAVLGQCTSLAHLNLGWNEIGDEGAGRLTAVLGQCASLAHLDLGGNKIGDEGAGRPAAVAEHCQSIFM